MGIIVGIVILLILLATAAKSPRSNLPITPRSDLTVAPRSFQFYVPPKVPTPRYSPVEKPRSKCIHCNGRGLIKCRLCNGRGGRYNPHDPIDHWSECMFCDGTGLVTCSLCNGMGYW